MLYIRVSLRTFSPKERVNHSIQFEIVNARLTDIPMSFALSGIYFMGMDGAISDVCVALYQMYLTTM